MRPRVAIAALAASLTLASCTGHPWWYRSGVSSCSPFLQYRLHGKVDSLGSCAGQLFEPPLVVRLRPGDKIDLHITQEKGAAPYMPPLAWSPADLMRLSAADKTTGTVTFTALRDGQADLSVHTAFCMDRTTSRPVSGECHALHVVVKGYGNSLRASVPKSGRY